MMLKVMADRVAPLEALLHRIVDPNRDIDIPATADKIIEIVGGAVALTPNTKSAPVVPAAHNSGEGLPNGDAAGAGADTGASAFTPAERT